MISVLGRIIRVSVVTGISLASTTMPAGAAPVTQPEPELQSAPARRMLKPATGRQTEGCWIRSLDPDRAVGRTKIAGEGYNNCLTTEPRMSVNAKLIRHRWWGWQRLAKDPTTVTGKSTVWSSAVWNCAGSGTYNYQTETDHKIWWRNGTTGFSVTKSAVEQIVC
jgi:hypothetical protein